MQTQVEVFLGPILILPFDSEAARKHASIRESLRNSPIGERDLVTASVAAANSLVLVTHNTREFSRIDNLTVEDWVDDATCR